MTRPRQLAQILIVCPDFMAAEGDRDSGALNPHLRLELEFDGMPTGHLAHLIADEHITNCPCGKVTMVAPFARLNDKEGDG